MLEFVIIPILLAFSAALVSGVVGPIIVVRSNTYVVGAVSHTILAGLGFAQFSNVTHLLPFYVSPDLAALFTAVIVAIVIAFFQFNKRVKQDSVLSAVWAVGMAVGLFFLTITPGYQTDLLRYMFGSIEIAVLEDVYFVFGLGIAIIVCCICFWRGIIASCFNVNLLRLNGGGAFFFELLISIISALAIVALVKTVGIVLVIALITLPSVVALGMRLRLVPSMVFAFIVAFISLVFGILMSAYCNIEASAPSIIFVAFVAVLAKIVRRIKCNEK